MAWKRELAKRLFSVVMLSGESMPIKIARQMLSVFTSVLVIAAKRRSVIISNSVYHFVYSRSFFANG